MQLTPVQKLSITIGAALLVLGLFGGMSYYYASRLVASDRGVERANANIAAALKVVVGWRDGERLAKAYVVRPDTFTYTTLQGVQAGVEDVVDAMARGTEDNPHQRGLMKELAGRTAASFSVFRTTMLVRDRAGADSARRVLSRDLPANDADSLMAILRHFRDEELRVLAEQTRLQSAHGANAQRIILVGMVLTFLLAGVALQPARLAVAARLTSHIVRAHETAGGASSDAGEAQAATAMQLQSLQRVVAALADVREPTAAAQALIAAATEALLPVLASVLAPDEAGGFAVLASSNAAFTRVTPELANPVAEVLRTGDVAMAESRDERERRWGSLGALDEHGAHGAVLFAPLVGANAATGVMIMAFADDHAFGDDEILFAATLGRLSGPMFAFRPPS